MFSSSRTEASAARAGREKTLVLPRETPAWWRAGLLLASALLIQSTVAPLLAVRGGTISVVMLVVLWYALRARPSGALLFGVLAGAGEDALGSSGAAWTLATGASAFLVARIGDGVPVDVLGVLIPNVGLIVFVRYLLATVVLALEGRPLAGLAIHVHAAIWQAVATALVALALLLRFPRLGGSRGRY